MTDLVLYVETTGTDAASATRPPTLAPGDYSADPFLTLQAAVDTARRRRPSPPASGNEDILIEVGIGTFAGATVEGFRGPGTLTIKGSTGLDTGLASGVNNGTAGAGTSATQLNKPAAAANWTADDLENRFLSLVSGGGAPAVRPIIANTTTAITVESVTGMDVTTVFQIIDHDTAFSSAVTVQDCDARVVLERAHFNAAAASSNHCRHVTFEACRVSGTGGIDSTDDGTVVVQNTVVDAALAVTVLRCQRAVLDHLLLDTGTLSVTGAASVAAQIEARNAAATPVSFKACGHCELGVSSSDNTGSGCLLDGCAFVESTGTGFVGTGNSAYGLDMQGPSWVDATGATITGSTNDFRVGGTADTWANLAARVSYIDLGTTAHVPGG